MLIDKIIVVLILLIPIFAFIFIFYNLFIRSHFNYDKFNPYRRYCKICGQQQDLYACSYSSNYTWWEDMYPIYDISCKCHKYSKAI